MILCLYFRMEKNMAEKAPINFLGSREKQISSVGARLCVSGEETQQTDHLSLKCSSLMKTAIPTSKRCENKLHSSTKNSIISLVVVVVVIIINYHCDKLSPMWGVRIKVQRSHVASLWSSSQDLNPVWLHINMHILDY